MPEPTVKALALRWAAGEISLDQAIEVAAALRGPQAIYEYDGPMRIYGGRASVGNPDNGFAAVQALVGDELTSEQARTFVLALATARATKRQGAPLDEVVDSGDYPESTSVLVILNEPQVLLVHLEDISRILDVQRHLNTALLAVQGAGVTTLGASGDAPASLLCFVRDGITAEHLELIWRQLETDHYWVAAYVPFHDHTVGHTHAFQRLYESHHSVSLFLEWTQMDADQEHYDVWMFGGSDSLDQAQWTAGQIGLEVTSVDGPHGIMALEAKVRDEADFAKAELWGEHLVHVRIPSLRRGALAQGE